MSVENTPLHGPVDVYSMELSPEFLRTFPCQAQANHNLEIYCTHSLRIQSICQSLRSKARLSREKIKSTGTEVNHLHVATIAASTRYNPQAEGISIHCITIHGLTTTSMKCKWGAVSNTSCFCHVLCPYNTAEEEQYDHYSGRSSRKVQLNVYPWSIYHYRPIISPERFCLVPEENHTEPHLRFNCVLPPPRCWRSLVRTQKSEWTLNAEEQVLALSVDDAFLRVHQPLNLGRMRVKLT